MSFKTKIARLLRQNETEAEKKLWIHLRNRKLNGLKFRRQHPLKEYIVDFFCELYGVIIEVDGKYHLSKEQREKDGLRDLHLQNLGYKVLRFSNDEVLNHIKNVLKKIKEAAKEQELFKIEKLESRKRRKKNREREQDPLTPTLSPGRGSFRILSTKKLTPSQKELLLNANISFVEYDSIHFTYTITQSITDFDNVIVTSKNGIISLITNNLLDQLKNKNWYCVGEKTAQALIENGIKPIEIGENAADLAQKLVKNHEKRSFIYFCGNLKRGELADILDKNSGELNEVEVYQTHFNDKKINSDFDGILFFSPSGIKSYLKQNEIDTEIAFCIGNTTANEVQKHTENIIVSNKPTVENTIVQVVKYANNERSKEA